MDLHSQRIMKFPKNIKQSMRNAEVPRLVCHLASYTLFSEIQNAAEHSVNHVTPCQN